MPTALPTVAEVRRDQESRTAVLTGARIAQSIAIAAKTGRAWQDVFADRWPRSVHIDQIKASVSAMGTGAAGALIQEQFLFAWGESLRAATVLGKLTGASPVGFNLRLITALSGAQAYWVGEGKAKPTTRASYVARSILPRRKVAGLAVMTDEVLLGPGQEAEALVQRELAGALVEMIDLTFLDPNNPGSPEMPASITAECYAVPSSGADPASIDADLAKALGHIIDAGILMTEPCLITSPSVALHLIGLRGDGGERSYPGVSLTGGELAGAPLIVSAAAGDQIVALDETYLLIARDPVEVRPSRQATVEMADNPTGDSLAPTSAASLVSLWQTNSVGMLVEQHVNWTLVRNEAVARVSDITLPVTP